MRFFFGFTNSNVYRFLLGFSALLMASALMAAEQVRVEEVSGAVQYRSSADKAWESAETGMSVSIPVEFQTLAGGHGLLVQAGSEFELKSGSHITLQADAAKPDGLVTKVKQWFGTVFYRIERQPDQFSVETPFLVSTVKGTRFVIVSTQSSSMVTLTEGSLEVLDIASGNTQMLEPGDVAGIGAEQAGIQTFKQAPQKSATQADSQSSSFQPAMEDTRNSFESALEAMTEIASEQALIASGDADVNQDGGDANDDNQDSGASDDGDTGAGSDDGGGSGDDGSSGGHGNGNGHGHGNGHDDHGQGHGHGHDGHDHDDDDDDDDDD